MRIIVSLVFLLFCFGYFSVQVGYWDLCEGDKVYCSGEFDKVVEYYQLVIIKKNSVQGNYNFGNLVYQ